MAFSSPAFLWIFESLSTNSSQPIWFRALTLLLTGNYYRVSASRGRFRLGRFVVRARFRPELVTARLFSVRRAIRPRVEHAEADVHANIATIGACLAGGHNASRPACFRCSCSDVFLGPQFVLNNLCGRISHRNLKKWPWIREASQTISFL